MFELAKSKRRIIIVEEAPKSEQNTDGINVKDETGALTILPMEAEVGHEMLTIDSKPKNVIEAAESIKDIEAVYNTMSKPKIMNIKEAAKSIKVMVSVHNTDIETKTMSETGAKFKHEISDDSKPRIINVEEGTKSVQDTSAQTVLENVENVEGR